ncbi:DUF2726 domain-containing protein, partial [Klebsiella variicola]|uniref:DUF2726 domain-containing protein n=1 Tax=Klebsiella variicola TaxID=244366 RepID=UPI00211458D2
MFKYFILRKQQQLFCYFCGIVLAMVLMLLFPSVFRGSGFYLLLSSVALFWAGLALYTLNALRNMPAAEKKGTSDIRPRSRTWWQLFRMASQWHCDVVIVDIHTFAIVGAVELDDASHLKKHRIRRDILLEEVLRQAG